MSLRGSAFDVSTRKVPSLALVPRGHLKHATRETKVTGSTKLKSKGGNVKQDDRAEDAANTISPSPPRPARQQTLSDMLEGEAEEKVETQEHVIKEESEEDEDEFSDDDQAELRLGERFLNLMALMTRLASQSLGDKPAPVTPSRLARANTERSILLSRSNTERVLTPVAPPIPAPLSPQRLQSVQPIQSPLKSPKQVVRDVAKRLPRPLQDQLTFDICMLLPAPLNERQSPLRSPIRRKRLRKRVRRRRLRRRAKRTWQASHASWPPHASADYILDHTRQDIAGVNATRLVERLGERKLDAPSLPRVLSMPLPPLLHRNNMHFQPSKSSKDTPVDEVEDAIAVTTNDHDSEDYESENEEEEEEDTSEHEETSEFPDDTADTVETLSSRQAQEHLVDKPAMPAKKQALYHQPAWISPELHAWLVESGLFATKPRRELLSPES